MVTEALAQLSTVFHRRFLLNALLPTLVFLSLLSAVFVASFSSLRDLGAWWEAFDVLSKIFTVLAYLAAVWFLAGAVASQWRGIVRFFEGYPAVQIWGDRVPGVAWHRARMRQLWVGLPDEGVEPEAHVAYPRYPLTEDEEDILPTRLGNALLAAERYSASRYGMDTIYFWPRLFPLLPEQFKSDYEKFMLEYEFPLVVAFQSMITAILGGSCILITGGSPLFFMLWFGGGSLVAYTFYILSLSSAQDLGEQQRAAFDLYRHLLLEQWPTPEDVRDEHDAFTRIQEFIVSNMSLTWGGAQQAHRQRQRANRCPDQT